MMELRESIYLMFMLLAHVMRGAGTFSLEDKIKMIQFVGYILNNTNIPLLDTSHNYGYNQTCDTNVTNVLFIIFGFTLITLCHTQNHSRSN